MFDANVFCPIHQFTLSPLAKDLSPRDHPPSQQPLSLGKMFFSSSAGAGPKPGFGKFGNKFGKLASDTLKGAKQASAKAVTAMAQVSQTMEAAVVDILPN